MKQFSVHSADFCVGNKYHLLVASCGGEQRCTSIARSLNGNAKMVAVFTYDEPGNLIAERSRVFFSKIGASLIHAPCDTKKWAVDTIAGICQAEESSGISVCIDISSFTRELIANWVFVVSQEKFSKKVVFDFVYSHAKYSPPPITSGLANRPTAITSDWAGVFTNQDLQQLLILGVGYEPNIALSFCEFLDPAKIIGFKPANHDPRYTNAIDRENAVFFDYIARRNESLVSYNVFKPYDLFHTLEYMILTSVDRYRINIAPYGLKLFALCGFLAASTFKSEILVWHLNPEQRLRTPNRIASGEVGCLRVITVDAH